jgi:ArsR family transcriptional regulator
MNIPTAASPEPLLARLDSLADPARLRLLHLLSAEELAVSELAGILQMPQSSVSRHLKLLGEQGFVVARAERTANYYRMANGELPASSRCLWELAAAETASWPALEHDRLRLARTLAARDEKSGDARAFYAGVAAEWERLRTDLYGERFTDLALNALLPPDWVVADLACGSGAVALSLAPWVARVVAVDHSREMLAAARKRSQASAHAKNVEWKKGELEALPLDDASCDAAVMLLALTHVEVPAAALGEMARIVRPGGRAVVVDLLRHDREAFRRQMGQVRSGFEAEELAALLETAGFTGTRCAPLPAEPEAKGPALLLASALRAASDGARSRSTDSGEPRASAGQPPFTSKLLASRKGKRK